MYWAYDDSITEETDPNCAKWFSINGTRHLVADCKVPNVQVDGLSVFRFNTNYGGTSVAAVDSEGVSSPAVASGQAVPPATYVIKYDGNGATGGTAPTSQSKTQYTDITLATNSGGLTRIGYRFSGWNTAPDGNGTPYPAGATYSADESVTLYAKWETVETVDFTLVSSAVDHGDTVTLSSKKQGATIYYRIGDADETTGTLGQPVMVTLYNEKYLPPDATGAYAEIPENGHVTITAYAKYADGTQSKETTGTYTLNQYTVSYNGNKQTGGTVPSQQTFYSGGSVKIETLDSDLIRAGYIKASQNWVDAEGNEQSGTYSDNADLSLKPKWEVAETIYVSSTGNDNTKLRDGSEAKPFKTVQTAVDIITGTNDGSRAYTIIVDGETSGKIPLDSTSNTIYIVDIWITTYEPPLTLTIKGKNGSSTDKITDGTTDKTHESVVFLRVGPGATVTLQNITLTGLLPAYGGSEVVINRGTLIMDNDAIICDNIGGRVSNTGTFTMKTGARITNNTSSGPGGGVYNGPEGTFTMEGGVISGNELARDSTGTLHLGDVQGGGVYNNGIFIMNGGEISGNSADHTDPAATRHGYGGGVYNGSTGTFEMNGGTISGNLAPTGDGNEVYNEGTFKINGYEVTGGPAFDIVP